MENPKTFQRLMEAAEKMRKNLTPNKEAELYIEELMDGEDAEESFSRESFKECIDKHFL